MGKGAANNGDDDDDKEDDDEYCKLHLCAPFKQEAQLILTNPRDAISVL